VPGEAVVALVLRRLQDARTAGDPIRAVVVGSGINCDGKTNGITAPSGTAQTELLRSVHQRAGVDPRRIEHVVAHGTATRLGDPVEVNALADALDAGTKETGWCAVTSIKGAIGHGLASAGLVSLVSLVLSMQRQMIPPSANFAHGNAFVRSGPSPVYVNGTSRNWPIRQDGPRFGAVSAFGMSGTNAHVLVASRDETLSVPQAPSNVLLVVSAATRTALQKRISALIAVLERTVWAQHELLQMSLTLLVGRHHFAHRVAVVASDAREASAALRLAQSGRQAPNVRIGEVAKGTSRLHAPCGSAAVAEGARDQLQALAAHFCAGQSLASEDLSGAQTVPRMALPTYPFDERDFWIAAEPEQPRPREPEPRTVLLAPNWTRVSPAMPTTGPAVDGRQVLIVGGAEEEQAAFREYYPDACFLASDLDHASYVERIRALSLLTDIVWLAPREHPLPLIELIAAQ
jgi:acyl transferase domain-containing protein